MMSRLNIAGDHFYYKDKMGRREMRIFRWGSYDKSSLIVKESFADLDQMTGNKDIILLPIAVKHTADSCRLYCP